jgi:hypothetical protein
MGKKRQTVSVAAELARFQGLYEGALAANRDLQAQLIELARTRESAAELAEKLLAGVKAIVNPDLAPPETNDLFTVVEPAGAELAKDPAFELSAEDWDWSDAMKEALQREEAEDAN